LDRRIERLLRHYVPTRAQVIVLLGHELALTDEASKLLKIAQRMNSPLVLRPERLLSLVAAVAQHTATFVTPDIEISATSNGGHCAKSHAQNVRVYRVTHASRLDVRLRAGHAERTASG